MDKIYIIDFGGQYAHLIANRIRRLNVLAEIKHPDDPTDSFPNARGLIFSGGPKSVYDKDRPDFNKEIFKLNIPILGLCFGHQLIVHEFGGKVRPGFKEYGVATIKILNKKKIFKNLAENEQVWMSHGDSVISIPEGFEVIAQTKDCPYAAIANFDLDIYGFQFHPEVTHTPHGMAMFENFIDICACRKEWTIKGFIHSITETVKTSVRNKKVFMLVSGGVDSTVAFTLLNEILGEDKVIGLNIDNGFCRKNEIDAIKNVMREHGYCNLIMKDYSDTFLNNLKGIVDPEEKRKIIGNTFIDVANQSLNDLNFHSGDWLLGQGTIYPDTIESGGTKNSALIKTHHNRVEIISEMIKKGLVIEPLSQLYKDEVRQLGIELGLPEELVWRHPFPGPGLAVRALCSNGIPDQIPMPDKEIFDYCKQNGLELQILPVKSVGVQGDSRTYAHPALIYGNNEWATLEKVSTFLTNNCPIINRVVTLIASVSLEGLHNKESYLTKDRLDLLREADNIAMNFLHEKELNRVIWQMPTVLVPLTSNGINECIVLRPVITRDFMTARFAEIPWDDLRQLGNDILNIGKIDAVFYDITHKPPGTIEWE